MICNRFGAGVWTFAGSADRAAGVELRRALRAESQPKKAKCSTWNISLFRLGRMFHVEHSGLAREKHHVRKLFYL
jgi:hypothetical protein